MSEGVFLEPLCLGSVTILASLTIVSHLMTTLGVGDLGQRNFFSQTFLGSSMDFWCLCWVFK